MAIMLRNTDLCGTCKCVWSYRMPFKCYTQWFTLYCIHFPGFAGTNVLEEANILMIGGCVLDTLSPLFKMYGLKEQDAKASTHIDFDKIYVSYLVDFCIIQHFWIWYILYIYLFVTPVLKP